MSESTNNLYIEDYGASVGSKRGYGGYRNTIRVKKFLRLIAPHPQEKILEIGCNTGLLLTKIKSIAPNSLGVDLNKELIAKLNNPSISYMSATNLKFKRSSFNKICAFEVIEHIKDLAKVFSEVYRVLCTDGEFIISFPLEFIRGQSAILDAWTVYKNPLMARQLHIHKLTPKKIKKIAEPLGFTIIQSTIMLIPFPSYVMKLKK
jgi:SAM-dependent methyltransferase